jgi:cell division protein FtsN
MVLALVAFLSLVSPRPACPETGPILGYQVGAFIDKQNAERLSAELLKRGFNGDVVKKTVQGRDYWAVTVLAPPNPFEDLQQELLDAGFSSFPVR